MKAFTVTGLTGSGKTSVIEKLIAEFVKRGYSVGSVKEIHYDAFRIDTEGKNTWRHRQAGADTVTARSHNETDVMYQGRLPIAEVVSHYSQDILALEGVRDALAPEIVCCKEDELPTIGPLTIAVSGRFANAHSGEYKGLPVINGITDAEKLTDLLLAKMPPLMSEVEAECCSKCGGDCKTFLSKCLKGEASASDCVMQNRKLSLKLNGKEIVIVPFVENILRNQILGVVSELKGYKPGCEISVDFLDNGEKHDS